MRYRRRRAPGIYGLLLAWATLIVALVSSLVVAVAKEKATPRGHEVIMCLQDGRRFLGRIEQGRFVTCGGTPIAGGRIEPTGDRCP